MRRLWTLNHGSKIGSKDYRRAQGPEREGNTWANGMKYRFENCIAKSDIKKSHKFVPKPVKFFPKPTKGFGDKLDFIEPESEEIYKVKDSDTVKTNHY
ncbi:hypothetical protein TNCV_413381 [Trichonephila clavipes]|nr:hypothetical protein TNCV_413381 [Trichonephila clavipes]